MNFTYSLFIMLMACQVILGQDCKPKGKNCSKKKGECVTDCVPDNGQKCIEKFCEGEDGCACKFTKKPVSCGKGNKCKKLEGECVTDCDQDGEQECNAKYCKGGDCICKYTKKPVVCKADPNCEELGGICTEKAVCKSNKDGFKCDKKACKGKKCACYYFPKSKEPAPSDDDSKPVGSDDETKAPAAKDDD